jgi:hypothetical protein
MSAELRGLLSGVSLSEESEDITEEFFKKSSGENIAFSQLTFSQSFH